MKRELLALIKEIPTIEGKFRILSHQQVCVFHQGVHI